MDQGQGEELTFSEWDDSDDKFAMRVVGNAMIEEHIADGDYVVIRRQSFAKDGEVAAIKDDEGEATLRRIFQERNRVRLEPGNKRMKPTYRDKVEILGVLVGVVRKY